MRVAPVARPSPEGITVAHAKARARQAWLAAKHRKVAPVPLLARWFADSLVAVEGASEPVAIILWGRSEVLYKLLVNH
jgi:hypothetical protein